MLLQILVGHWLGGYPIPNGQHKINLFLLQIFEIKVKLTKKKKLCASNYWNISKVLGAIQLFHPRIIKNCYISFGYGT